MYSGLVLLLTIEPEVTLSKSVNGRLRRGVDVDLVKNTRQMYLQSVTGSVSRGR